MPYNANQNEQDILKFWEEKQIFEKTISSRPENKPYAFYDGPPFATGLPHYGHIVAGLMKDVVPRYFTMKGYRVERRWGWDCHGLPIENIIEKELNLTSKKDIEEYGITNFNEACRATVLKYAEDWKKVVKRMGRFVDMENDYKTMDLPFMESVWWVFKQLWDKGLIYEGHKAMHICPRCVTPLSNFEVTQGYKDVKDISATAKFKVKSKKEKEGIVEWPEGDVYVLAWTTTPWTLPGNVLLAVGGDIDYLLCKLPTVGPEDMEQNTDMFVVAKDRAVDVFAEKGFEVIAELKGNDLVGLTYEPLFSYFKDTPNAFRIVAAEFVTTDDGTGVVHIAPAFGEDDYNVGKHEDIPLVQHVRMDGHFIDEVEDFVGLEVKPKDDPTSTDIEVIKWLAHNGKLFSKKKFEHTYPHCWRCDTPLLNYATSSWFVKVTHIKDDMLKNNAKTNWVPENVKDNRFGKWLEGARDWAISRNRFWGAPLPVWKSEDGDIVCIGSVEELEILSGQKVTDLHKHIVDLVTFEKDGKTYTRIPEVLDCWFESGSMPYGQMHYPFENKEKFESVFPAQFIAEGQDQTRGWFYTLHVLATALTRGENPSIPTPESMPAFQNVIVNGIVLAEDGKKMSKRLKNYPDPMEVLEKYGADAMRYYLVTSPVMHAESLNFSESGVREMYNKVVNMLSNVVEFYQIFAAGAHPAETRLSLVCTLESRPVLDKWILAKLQELIRDVSAGMDAYKLADASRPIESFIAELSQWYVRRSRDRFKDDDEADKAAAIETLREVLLTLSKVMAPFTPFIAEKVYRDMGGEMESVHLETWPEVDEKLLNTSILEQMTVARNIVEIGLALRAEAGIKIRQVLGELAVQKVLLSPEIKSIIADELNVKLVVDQPGFGDNWKGKEDQRFTIMLNTEITEALKKEGMVREIVRTINQMRKEMGLTIQDRVIVVYTTEDQVLQHVFDEYGKDIMKSVLADSLRPGEGKEVEIDGRKVQIDIVK